MGSVSLWASSFFLHTGVFLCAPAPARAMLSSSYVSASAVSSGVDLLSATMRRTRSSLCVARCARSLSAVFSLMAAATATFGSVSRVAIARTRDCVAFSALMTRTRGSGSCVRIMRTSSVSVLLRATEARTPTCGSRARAWSAPLGVCSFSAATWRTSQRSCVAAFARFTRLAVTRAAAATTL